MELTLKRINYPMGDTIEVYSDGTLIATTEVYDPSKVVVFGKDSFGRPVDSRQIEDLVRFALRADIQGWTK